MFLKKNSIISQDSSSSDQEMEVQSPQCFLPSTSQSQSFVQPMFMPYIEGPKMDWTVNDSSYHRLLKWKLKCENILDCKLATLPESKKCKKVTAWSGGFGMDQCVVMPVCRRSQLGCYLGPGMKISTSCRPMKLEPDLTCGQASDKAIIQKMSGTMQFKLVSLAKYPPRNCKYLALRYFLDFSSKIKSLFPKPSMIPI